MQGHVVMELSRRADHNTAFSGLNGPLNRILDLLLSPEGEKLGYINPSGKEEMRVSTVNGGDIHPGNNFYGIQAVNSRLHQLF